MGKVTFIIGYCGSGKSCLADQMELELGVRKFDEGFLKDTAQHAQLIQALRSNVDCAVVEIHYCLEQYRRGVVEELERVLPGVVIEWIYFEADIDKANENCRNRCNKSDPGGKIHIEINGRIGSAYVIPRGVTPRPIFQMPKCQPEE